MPRYVLLQKLDDVLLVAPVAALPGAPTTDSVDVSAPVIKEDVSVSFGGVDSEGHFSFAVPSYDPATHNMLDAIHVGLFEKPADGTAPTLPTDPAEIETAALHYVTDTTKIRGAETVIVDATDAPEGDYVALLVLEFAE